MEFDSEVHQRTEIKLICASEELIDTLEENQACCYCHMITFCWDGDWGGK